MLAAWRRRSEGFSKLNVLFWMWKNGERIENCVRRDVEWKNKVGMIWPPKNVKDRIKGGGTRRIVVQKRLRYSG
jgi:hypothetical protein